MSETAAHKTLDARAILEALPHRYPFLLVDRVVEATPEGTVALKNVSLNEPFFQGHFPGHPVMPGVLILEALAQAAALHAHAEASAWPAKDLYMTVRVAVTGRTATPPLFETLGVLGKEVTRRRLRRAAEALKSAKGKS